MGRAAAGVGDRGESRRVADPSREVPRRRGEMRRPHAWCDGSTSPAAFLLAAAAICGQFATGACCVSSLSLSALGCWVGVGGRGWITWRSGRGLGIRFFYRCPVTI